MSEPLAPAVPTFADLALPDPLLRALADVGYETPTPIQAATLPALLAGQDLLGHAPTGTGKTAAFALPALARLVPGTKSVSVLVLTPTRELAIQVAEAFVSYATHMRDFRVVPIYGGQDYGTQIRQLSRGVQVVVGTPGRIMDHLRRGTLDLGNLQTLVLDEADEMLRMGFIDDVEWILEQTPATRQTALFSATMPRQVARIARKHLRSPAEISIEGKRETAAAIHQRYWLVSGMQKLEALTRILEVERFDGMLIFVRTRTLTTELADKLGARGFATAAINGDMLQKAREQTVDKLKRGQIDILVATDVVARGLDVERISHVVNYDIPHDTEAYVHRIGRTGRAGRSGEAILFVAPRERGLLGAIERTTGSKIELMDLPSVDAVNQRRVEDFTQAITATLANSSLGRLQALVDEYALANDVPANRVAAALAQMALGDRPLYLKEDSRKARKPARKNETRQEHAKPDRAAQRAPQSAPARQPSVPSPKAAQPIEPPGAAPGATPASNGGGGGIPMDRYRVEIGQAHGVTASHLVGAIANEAGLDAAWIGKIKIDEQHSTVELPEDMPKPVLRDLRKAWVLGRRLGIARADAPISKRPPRDTAPDGAAPPKRKKRPAGSASTSFGGKPAGKPPGKPQGKNAGKNTSKSGNKPTGKSADKSHKKTRKKS